MDELYRWATGPLVWAAFIIFIGGSLFRLVHLITPGPPQGKVHLLPT
ncbi:MAG: hypothetical protein MZV70_20080 [Desulfobacterales bacterium]|nr:hypothetical protein [Desulfobacterales bacterium]